MSDKISDPPDFLKKPGMTPPTAREIAAALLAYDRALEGVTLPTSGQRLQAMETALHAAFVEGGRG